MTNNQSRKPIHTPVKPLGWLAWGMVGDPLPERVFEAVDDGVRLVQPDQMWEMAKRHKPVSGTPDDLLAAVAARHWQGNGEGSLLNRLVLPDSQRWRDALSTALIGPWASSLDCTSYLPCAALSVLRAEVRTLHRQLGPIWRRRTRHGPVLSLDACLGDGLSLHDLIAANGGCAELPTGKVFDDERLNTVIGALAPAERAVVIAYAKGEGTTWTEAAAATGAADPEAFGERVRRKAKRLATEQKRRLAQRRTDMRRARP
ncbi:hypothetical protein ABZT04_43000 [Streptomyces sp. NPDC005492]|uniref:hypothetical protein n=1 Tax=Streptomyces sp. NPDC005492 TaxID=3156883 RepID=UPI0033BCE797